MERAAAPSPRLLIDILWPAAGLVRDVTLVLGGALLITLSAQVRIPLPFSPVPITGQTFAIMLIAATYGSVRGASTVLAYLAMGLSGLPVFASAAPGIGALVSPTAGYMLGWIPATYVVGALSERGASRSPWTMAASMVIASFIIFAMGALWLGPYVGWNHVISTGVLPFLPGDAIKIALAMIALPTAWRVLGSGHRPG